MYPGITNKKTVFQLDKAVGSVLNKFGNNLWLKLERNLDEYKGFDSAEGKKMVPNWCSN